MLEEKVLGTGKYPDDFYFEGMLYGVALRSKYPRARILSIDTSKAAAFPGVEAVVTAEDIPGENKIGHLKHDQYTLIPVGGLTHYLGDAIALVAARDRETAEKARKLIKVEYEVLPHVHTIEEAAAPDAPKVFDEEENNICAYKHISRGNAEEAIRNSKYVISHHFETPWTEHAFLEPECAVSFYDEDGDIFVYSTDQLCPSDPARMQPASWNRPDKGTECFGRRRLWRQGRYDRAAFKRTFNLRHQEAGEGKAHKSRISSCPSQTSSVLYGCDNGL